MLRHGDLFDVLFTLEAESVDACVTDPPYGIAFMNKAWDNFSPEATAQRIVPNRAIDSENPNLKGRTRGPASSPSAVEYNRSLEGQREFQDWTAQWAAEVLRVLKPGAYAVVCGAPRSHHRMMSGLEDAGFVIRDCMLFWGFGQGFPKSLNLGEGRGTALKPSYEPIALAWKPFKGTINANLARWGTGALNIDATRITSPPRPTYTPHERPKPGEFDDGAKYDGGTTTLGRWPANVILDDEAAQLLDAQTGKLASADGHTRRNVASMGYHGSDVPFTTGGPADCGGASRFYYVAKPSREERDYGLNGGRSTHPTVKPVELMRWLVKLVTPIGGTVLDPFAGSGTTGMACRYEQREFLGIEREREYVEIAERRIAAVCPLF